MKLEMKLEFIGVAEAAACKGVSRSAIYKAVATGRLKAYRVLGKVALREGDVKAWQTFAAAGRPRGSSLSPETKQRIAKAQRERWARRKKVPKKRLG
jgi:excisionase family DNA binding protein